jgi:Zn-dependent oligopeptidase
MDFKSLQTNYNEEKGFLSFTAAELDGVPKDVISGYKKHQNADIYDVTYKSPDILPIVSEGFTLFNDLDCHLSSQFRFAINPETRKRAFVGSENRLAVNEQVLEDILVLRREIASLLGYTTWADYIIEAKVDCATFY